MEPRLHMQSHAKSFLKCVRSFLKLKRSSLLRSRVLGLVLFNLGLGLRPLTCLVLHVSIGVVFSLLVDPMPWPFVAREGLVAFNPLPRPCSAK
eukprot:6187644-Amphidinium_carterae.1